MNLKMVAQLLKLLNSNSWKFYRPLFLLGATVCFCLAGCVGPDYHAPETKMPKDFIASAHETKEGGIKPVIDAAKWWQSLNDQELNSLIDRAIQNNLDLEIALDRLQQARTEEAVILGESMPEAGASGSAARGTGSNLTRGQVAAPLGAGEHTGSLKHVTDMVGFDAGWELDIFGKYRRKMEAAKYDTQAAIAARNSVLISVIANVARAYIDMRSLQVRLAVLQKNTEVAEDYLNLTKERFNRGITNELDFTLAQRQLERLQAEKMPLLARVYAAQYVIAVLLGKFPKDLEKELEKPGMIPILPEEINAGVPLDLLRRRPDIQEAERELAGATARIGVATAELFPHVFVTAGVGYQQQGLGVTPDVTNFIWSVGPKFNWALLDFGTIDALIEKADLHTREMLAKYKLTVINAVQEVDTSIDSYNGQQDRLRSLSKALIANQRAVSLAIQRYDRGLTDSLNVIDAERQEYELESEYVSSQQTAAEQFIILYKALGGGWEQYQSLPRIHMPQPAVVAIFTRLLSSNDPQKDTPTGLRGKTDE